jgi:hypothetical protein
MSTEKRRHEPEEQPDHSGEKAETDRLFGFHEQDTC